MTDIILVGVGLILLVGNFVFVAAEFSFVTVDPGLVDKKIAEGDKRMVSVRKAITHLSTELSGAQVGITLTVVLLGYTMQPAMGRLLADSVGSAVLAGTISAIVVNTIAIVFGELVPKNLAIAEPVGTAKVMAPLQRGFTMAFKPLILFFNNTANSVLHRFGLELREELAGGRSPQELAALVRRSAQIGTLEASTATLLTNSIDFQEMNAVDVMTDRTRMEVLNIDETAADVIRAARKTGHSRFPVIVDTRDDIVGLVNLRSAVGVAYEDRETARIADIMTDVARVPETVDLGNLLLELRGVGSQIAIVVNEYGGTSGLVTLEDVVEELVGEVSDEHDRRRSGVYRIPDGSWSVPGVLRPDELLERTGIKAPEDEDYETLAGLVMQQLGRIPREHDEVVAGHAKLVVTQMQGRRVERLRVHQIVEDEEL